MPDSASPRPEQGANPSVRRITVAHFENSAGLTASVVDFNRHVEPPAVNGPWTLSRVRHFEIPVENAVLEVWAVFERDLLSAAVWLGIESAPMTKNSWRNLVAMDRAALIGEIVSELLRRDAPLLNGFEDRALDLKHLRDRIATRNIVYQPLPSDYLVLTELTGPGRGAGDLIPYAELQEMLGIAERLDEVLRYSVTAVGGDPAIFDYQTEYSREQSALLAVEAARTERAMATDTETNE